MQMELAKLTSKGQLTVPVAIRERLRLREGDKVVFLVDDEGIRIMNASLMALDKVREAFRGEAERVGIKTEQDVVDLVKDVRKELARDCYENTD